MMSFGENLQFLRKQKNMTQEDLAEKLEVSRQTVSKWESDGAFPEMEKLVYICNVFGVSTDIMLRGSAEKSCSEDTQNYDSHMNKFTVQIMVGVILAMVGISLMIFANAFDIADGLKMIPFFAFLIVSVSIFVVSGINHDAFVKDNPIISWRYPDKKIKEFRIKLPILIVIPIAIILLDIMLLIVAYELPVPENDFTDCIRVSIFLMIIAIAVPFFIYAGMQSDKYNIEDYNQKNGGDINSENTSKKTPLSEKICSVIMLVATASFLLLGFVWNAWHPGWVVFPVGGILCGAVSIIIGDKK